MDEILTVDQLMEQYITVFREKNADYGASFEKYGQILVIMCPNGIHLNNSDGSPNSDKVNAFGTFSQVLHKMNRYASLMFGPNGQTNFEAPHDTATDMSVYSAMLDYLTLAYEREMKYAPKV